MSSTSDPGPRWVPPTPGDTIDEGRSFAAVAQALFRSAPAAPQVGRYYLLERIGDGGMGVVYVGYDPTLERRVAIKFLHDRKRGGDRIRQEGRALANLEHPNVVTVHEVGEDNGAVYLVMAHVEGETLDVWLGASRRPWREVLRLLRDAGRGIAAVHDAGLAHRDIKPSNLLVDTHGQVRVADFGLAIRVDTESGGVRVKGGTEAYMAPEQAAGDLVGPASDQYAFCVCLLEGLAGLRPGGEGPVHWRRATAEHDPDGAAPPMRVFEAIERGLQDDPAARHPSMAALLEELEPEQRSAGWRWLAAGVLVATAGLVVGLSVASEPGAAEPSRCASLVGEFEREHWDARRRLALLSAGPGRSDDPLWAKAVEGLDDYAQRWERVSLEGCDAHRGGRVSASTFDDRRRCLQRLARDFDGLTLALIRESNVGGGGALDAVSSMEHPPTCELPRTVLELVVGGSVDPGSAEEALQRDVADAWARVRMLLPPQVDEKALEARTAELEDGPLRADAYRLLSGLAPTIEEKQRLVDRAVRSALAGRAHVMLTASLIEQGKVYEVSDDLEGSAQRFELARASLHAVDELTEDFPGLRARAHRLHGQLELAQGNLSRRQGDLARHLEHESRALEFFETAQVRRPIDEIRAWNNVGEANRLLSNFEDAEHAYVQAIALARPLLPPHGGMLETILVNQGSARQEGGDWSGALEVYAEVLPPGGVPETVVDATAVFNIALMDEDRGDWESAARRCRQGLDVVAGDGPQRNDLWAPVFALHCAADEDALRADGVSLERLAPLYQRLETRALGDPSVLVLGQVHMARAMIRHRRFAEASVWLERARVSATGPEDRPMLSMAPVEHLAGQLAEGVGDLAAARAAYRRSVTLFEAHGVDSHPRLVDPLLALAAIEDAPNVADGYFDRAAKLIERYEMHASKAARLEALRAVKGVR